MSLSMKENYEILYKDLKKKYEQIIKGNDDVFKEYDLTIDILTDSVQKLQNENLILENKYNKIQKDLTQNENERENLISKNKEKIKEIQSLNKINEKLNEDVKYLGGEKELTNKKIVSLENSNEKYKDKIRQNEAIIDDLNNQLESILEKHIILKTEYELYKDKISHELIKKQEEINNIKNENKRNSQCEQKIDSLIFISKRSLEKSSSMKCINNFTLSKSIQSRNEECSYFSIHHERNSSLLLNNKNIKESKRASLIIDFKNKATRKIKKLLGNSIESSDKLKQFFRRNSFLIQKNKQNQFYLKNMKKNEIHYKSDFSDKENYQINGLNIVDKKVNKRKNFYEIHFGSCYFYSFSYKMKFENIIICQENKFSILTCKTEKEKLKRYLSLKNIKNWVYNSKKNFDHLFEKISH